MRVVFRFIWGDLGYFWVVWVLGLGRFGRFWGPFWGDFGCAGLISGGFGVNLSILGAL